MFFTLNIIFDIIVSK